MRKLLWPFKSTKDLRIHAGSHFVWKENSTGDSGITAKHLSVGGAGARSSLHLKWQGRRTSHMSAISLMNTDVIMDGAWDVPAAKRIHIGSGSTLHLGDLTSHAIHAPKAKISLDDVTINFDTHTLAPDMDYPVLLGRNIVMSGPVHVARQNDKISVEIYQCALGLYLRTASVANSLAA